METQCVPAVDKNGKILLDREGRRKARLHLELREGPFPFQKAICRHLCKNDSMAPNGFVCTLHTTWGTYSENMMDRSTESKVKSGRNGGRISGKISGKIVAPIINARPDHPNKTLATCPHCDKVTTKMNIHRHHLDRCKHKPQN